jgi:hypothetical protein
MLDAEEALQQRLNESGTLATAEVLQRRRRTLRTPP